MACWRVPRTSRPRSSCSTKTADAELEAELDRNATALETDFARERTALLFSGEYDDRAAILTISAGRGRHRGDRLGRDAAADVPALGGAPSLQDRDHRPAGGRAGRAQERHRRGRWPARLRLAARRARRAPARPHQPIRLQKRRQTTFALVEVLPEVDDDIEIELDWDEIRVDTYRSQGAGGQHVNKTDSAVRLTHNPTGIVVQSQNERSQTQNKENATKVLKARLLERALEEKEAELRALKGEHVEAGWGNQIRSYVLHPYQMVKDLRTGYETGNTTAVLDGDLDAFMQAELERLATGDGWRGGDSEGDAA